MTISTTITKRYFSVKMEDLAEAGCFWEFKEFKKHWIKRLDTLVFDQEQLPVDIVFLIGNEPHSFKAIKVWIVQREIVPEKYKSAITTEKAYAIKCVETN